MRRATVVTAVCVCLLSCSKKASAPESGPAGKVVSAAGSVSAERDGQAARPLAKGAQVFADDLIVTGEDGQVAIALDHNRATLELGPNNRVRLRESLAWEAEPESKGSVFDDTEKSTTTAAGRHSENEAAGTASTAMPQVEKEVAATAESAADQAGAPADTAAKEIAAPQPASAPEASLPPPAPGAGEKGRVAAVEERRHAKKLRKRSSSSERESLRGGMALGDDSDDEVVRSLGVAKKRPASRALEVEVAAGGGLTAEAIRKRVGAKRRQLERCAPALDIRFVILPDGKISKIESVPGQARACVEKALSALVFGSADKSTTVSVTLGAD